MSSDFELDPQKVAGSGEKIIETAGEALANRELVRYGVGGLIFRADASAQATLPCVGMALANAATGQGIEILLNGFIGLSTWTWTAGDNLYVGDVAGTIVAAPGTVTQRVAVARTATQIFFEPKEIDLGSVTAAHILATTGPHTNTLPLTDLEVGVRGEVIHRGAADWEALGVGVALQALISGGPGADVSWGAPTPAAHVLATTGPHTGALPLVDLEVGVQGEVIHRGVADWEALGVGVALQALISGGAGADVSWGAPTPAAHVLATTGPHSNTLPLADLAVGARGEIIARGAADWEALGVGAAGQALLSGGVGADVSWGAPAPAVHAGTHSDGAADEIEIDDLAGAAGAAGEIVESDGAAMSFVEPDGRYAPAGHQASHTDGQADEIEIDDLPGANGAAGEIVESDGAAMAFVEPDGRYDPAAHQGSHNDGAADELEIDDLPGANGAAGEIVESDGAAMSFVEPDGRYTPAAHATTHQSGGSDETRDIEMEPGLGDETADGLKATVTVGENVVTGDTLYMKADGKYWKADADAGASMPAKVLVVSATIAADAAGIVLHEGYYRNDDRYNWTLGNGEANLLFQHTTGGEIVQLANQPAGAGDQVQVVGWVVDANTIYFRPSLELVEIAA